MRGPNFIIAGGHKCATTTLHSALSKVSQISMSGPKEPHYFAGNSLESRLHQGVWTSEEYEELWGPSGFSNQVRGEASALYLYFAEEVVRAIQREMVHAPKIIVSVRNPIERAYSSFWDVRLKNPAETAPTFDVAVNRELDRGAWRIDGAESPTMRHLALGIYSHGIRTFRRAFGSESVLVIDFDDIVHKPRSVKSAILGFLDIEDDSTDLAPDEVNRGRRVWRSSRVGEFGRWPITVGARRALARVAPKAHRRLRGFAVRKFTVPVGEMGRDTQRALVKHYRAEIGELEEILGRDLSHWLASS